MGAVRSLVDALVLRHLVGGVDETVCDLVSAGSWSRTIDLGPLACDGACGQPLCRRRGSWDSGSSTHAILKGCRVVGFEAASGSRGWSLNAEVELRSSLIRSLDDGLVDRLVSLVSASMTKLRHCTRGRLAKPWAQGPNNTPCQKFFISKSRTESSRQPRFLLQQPPPHHHPALPRSDELPRCALGDPAQHNV